MSQAVLGRLFTQAGEVAQTLSEKEQAREARHTPNCCQHRLPETSLVKHTADGAPAWNRQWHGRGLAG